MGHSGPLVSIGVPVYNGEPFIREALDSIVGQTYDHLEVIICDNASTDNTGAICQEYAARDKRIRYFRNESNIGCLPNIRRVLALCSGEYCTWTCADDVRPPTAVADALSALQANERAVFAHGPVQVDVLSTDERVEVKNEMDLSGTSAADRVRSFTHGLRHNAMIFGLYRRETFDRLVLGTHSGHDYLFCLQACLQGPVEYIPSPVIVYRQKGPVDSPMHTRAPITIRDLLVYRGVRRSKCWIVLLLGAYYLANAPGISAADRLGGIAAHVSSFVQRYRSQLAGEIPFILCMPLLWLASPLVPTGRRLKTALKARRAAET